MTKQHVKVSKKGYVMSDLATAIVIAFRFSL